MRQASAISVVLYMLRRATSAFFLLFARSGVDHRGEHRDAAKVVMTVYRNGVKRHDECSPKMSYVIVGGHQHEWLQVAGWLAQHGAREIVAAVDCSAVSASLLRHRQRALRRQFAANLRVEDARVRAWDEAAALHLVRAAAAVAPIDAIVVLAKVESGVVRDPDRTA